MLFGIVKMEVNVAERTNPRLITLDPTPFFNWFDDVLGTGAPVITFNGAKKAGEDAATHILKERSAENTLLGELSSVAMQRGLGYTPPLSDELLRNDRLEVSIFEPPTTRTEGAFTMFLAGFWCGAIFRICGRRFKFEKALFDDGKLTLCLRSDEPP